MVAVTYKLQELPKLLDLPIVYWLLLICSDKGLVERLSAFLIDIARIQGLARHLSAYVAFVSLLHSL